MDATNQQLRRRKTGKKVIGIGALTASAAMVATALIVPAANADDKTPTSVSAAHGHGLEIELAGGSLVGSADAYRQWAASGQTGTASNTLDLNALGLVNLDLGGLSVPLLSDNGDGGLLDLGSLGALTSFADSPYQSVSTASSGILGDSGSVMLSPAEVPTTFQPATLDLTKLLGSVPLIDQTVLSQAALEIGAVGSSAFGTTGVQAPATEYMVAGAKLSVDSPLVETLASTLNTTVTGLGSTLDAAVGSTGVVGQAVSALPDINIGILRLDLSGGTAGLDGVDAALSAAATTLLDTPLEDANKIVSINLGDGTILVDLAQVVDGGDLNGLDPNTEVLDAATLSKITAAVTEALASLTSKVTTVVTDVVNNLSVTITLPVKLSTLLIPAMDEIITVEASLGQLTGAVPGTPVVSITNNNPSLIGTILTALGITDLLAFIVDDVVGTLVAGLQPVIDGLLTTVGTGLADTLNPVVTTTLDGLSPALGLLNQVASVRINEQPSAAPISGVGDFGAGSTTVRALAVTLLPSGSSGAARVELASSTVKHKFDASAPGDANTNASASAAASAQATATTDTDASAQVAAQAAAMADNSVSADASAATDAVAAAKSTSVANTSENATTDANSSAYAAAVGSNDSTADSAQDADGSVKGGNDSGAASEAAAQTNASADASTAAAGTTSGSTSTSTTTADTTADTTTAATASTTADATASATAATTADATADANGSNSNATGTTNANVNAAASASADSNANAAAKAAAMADATSTASAKATANAQAAAESAATTTASTKASTKADAASIAAAQAAALAKANTDTNSAASAKANSNASAAAKAAAIADASSDASGNNPNPNTAKCLTPSPKTPFLDTPTNHKFYTEIDWMYCMKYTTGIKSDAGLIYGPQLRLSREAMAAFIYRMEADPNWKLPAESPFADMKPGDKFYKEIVWMHDQGLSTGIKQDSGKPIYGPKMRLTREAMAAFIYRLEAPNYTAFPPSKMQDMKPGDKFYTEINWMVDEGLSTGIRVENGSREYWPKSKLSREAMAAFIHRLVNDYRG